MHPGGTDPALRLTAELNPLIGVTERVELFVAPAVVRAKEVGLADTLKS